MPWFDASDAFRRTEPESDVWQLTAAMLHQPLVEVPRSFGIALAANDRDVVAAFDHLIADGVSAGIFAAELGACLAGR